MRILTWLGALQLAFCFAPQLAFAQDDDAPLPECTAANSEPATIRDLWSQGRELSGDCVAIRGYRAGDVIFTDQRAYYAYNAKRLRAPAGVIGIPYPGLRGADAGLMRGIYYGRVRLCSDDRRSYRRSQVAVLKAAEQGELMMTHLYGFCATSLGPAVRVETVDEAPASDLVRLTDDGLRRSLGELALPKLNYPYAATLDWLGEVATEGHCSDDFKPGVAPPGPVQGQGVPLWRPTIEPRRSIALAKWCGTNARQTVTYLVGRSSPSAYEAGVALDMVICVCTLEECEGRWPVALLDTGWDSARPYFCQRAKLRPGQEAYAEGEATEYSNFSYEFAGDYIASGAGGFPEGAASPPAR